MLRFVRRTVLGVAVVAVAVTQAASASVYINKRYCGGDNFATCAAVMMDVTGTTVTLRLWNLSGNTAASYGTATNAGSVFTAIGLYNIPVNVDAVLGTLTTSTGAANKIGSPLPWQLSNNSSVGFLVDMGVAPVGTNYANGLASGCATPAQLPGANLFVNPCADPGSAPLSDWLTFTFQVTAPFDATNAQISLRMANTTLGRGECWTGTNPSGNAANCFEVVPEPMTTTLLATGLVGLGGVGYVRRRRNGKSKA